MIHRKPCGCVTEVSYINSIHGLKLVTKIIKQCTIHQKPKEKPNVKRKKPKIRRPSKAQKKPEHGQAIQKGSNPKRKRS